MGIFEELTDPNVVIVDRKSNKVLDVPEGFTTSHKSRKVAEKVKAPTGEDKLNELKLKKAWESAIGPAKSLPMNMIMSYMTGNSLQLIPMMMTFMLVWNPLRSIFKDTNNIFNRYVVEDNKPYIQGLKVVYVLCQFLNMGLGIWKLDRMGLVPHREGDWLAWKVALQFKEKVYLF